MKRIKMRITLTTQQVEAIEELYHDSYGTENYFKVIEEIFSLILEQKHKKQNPLKIKAVKKATEARSKKAKDKIINSINILRMEGKKLSVNAVAKDAGVSYNTAVKYKEYIEAQNYAK